MSVCIFSVSRYRYFVAAIRISEYLRIIEHLEEDHSLRIIEMKTFLNINPFVEPGERKVDTTINLFICSGHLGSLSW